ncbi:MAG TPA: LptE family protein [Candidatus Krumholzibacteria bacterium]|nr:LptE family protein [Candidatus Krumholzibacteria bacterium]
MHGIRFHSLLSRAILIAIVGLQLGCGYALVGRASNLPSDVHKIFVKPLENRTTRSQVEQYLTRAVADELVSRQRFQVVNDASSADAVLSGAVTAFNATPVTFDSSGRATEYEITIIAQVALKRAGSGTVLWSNDNYLFRENYPVEVSSAGFFDEQNLALQQVSKKFAETLVSDLQEGF